MRVINKIRLILHKFNKHFTSNVQIHSLMCLFQFLGSSIFRALLRPVGTSYKRHIKTELLHVSRLFVFETENVERFVSDDKTNEFQFRHKIYTVSQNDGTLYISVIPTFLSQSLKTGEIKMKTIVSLLALLFKIN